MKKVLSVLVIALALSVSVIARTQSNSLAPAGSDNGKSGKAEDEKTAKTKESGKPANDPKDKKNKEQGKSSAPVTADAKPLAATDSGKATTDAPEKTVTTAPNGTPPTTTPATSEEPSAKKDATTSAPSQTNIYRVGAGDVLDIRLLNTATRESTLFTVMASGLLEYPLAGEPFSVAGLTTDEIHERLISKIKLYDNPQVAVSVRQYASHNVIVSGLVNDPGTKVLRREAMPLYVVLAEAQLKPEAGQATIVHLDRQSLTVNLSDPKATTTFVLPGDVITVTALPPAPPQYFYIGGQITSPGQKDFHAGMTLTQAILASGGATRFAGGKVKVARQGADGRLVTTEYNLKQIESGKIPDPMLQPGDRVDVGRSGW
jgi:protein involved in polysaccharide export with SLBB domain